jgi:hypothetical protein
MQSARALAPVWSGAASSDVIRPEATASARRAVVDSLRRSPCSPSDRNSPPLPRWASSPLWVLAACLASVNVVARVAALSVVIWAWQSSAVVAWGGGARAEAGRWQSQRC